MRLEYSVEESPLGTAGSVKNAAELLDDTFVVISGDALCDIDLGALVAFHRERGALATLALKSVENPLEFGVVITDEDGRIERFLEKPSWGQVFSDTINTGIYVVEPEVLRWVPQGEPFDFAKQLFPRLLEMGKPLYGYVLPEDEYWLDIGNLEQYRQANEDVLDGRCRVDVPGIRLKENIWLGDGVALPGVDVIEGPAFLGNYCKIEEGARIGPYAVLGPNVAVKQGAHVERSVLDGGTYVGGGAVVTGAIVGRNCDIRAHARIDAGVAIGDECSIGAESMIAPNVRVYPFKTIEAGAQVHQNLIWESRGVSTLFTGDGVEGIVNVDVTPEVAVRLGLAFGTHLERGDRIAASRDGHPAARMIKRAMIAGVNATGVHISDLRVAAPAMNRHEIKSSRLAGGMHVAVAERGSRDDRDPVLRPRRRARVGRLAAGHRALLHPPGVPPLDARRHRRADLPGAGGGDLRRGARRHPRPRRRRPARLPLRHRLRPHRLVLGGAGDHGRARRRGHRAERRARRRARRGSTAPPARPSGWSRRPGPTSARCSRRAASTCG